MAILSLDLKNAFNLINRQLMLRGILQYCPSLARWFQWAYGHSSSLVLTDGTVVGSSETGCRQGDPLAPLCFCVGFHFALLQISKMQDETVGTDGVDGKDSYGVFAYMDDANIYVDRRIADKVAGKLNAVFNHSA
jgi:hypothetical protein